MGKLLKPGEQPSNYSDEEDEPTGSSDKSGTGEDKPETDSEEKKDDEKKKEWANRTIANIKWDASNRQSKAVLIPFSKFYLLSIAHQDF